MLHYYHSFHIKYRYLVLAVFLLAAMSALFYFVYPLRATEIHPGQTLASFDTAEIKIKFNRPIFRRSLSPIISPDLSGEWKFKDPLFDNHLYTSVIFTPFETLAPNTEYQIHLGNIDPTWSSKKHPIGPIIIKTPALPEITGGGFDFSKPLLPRAGISIKFDKPIDPLIEIRAAFEPLIDFEEIWNNAKTQLDIRPKTNFSQGADYAISVRRSYFITDRQGAVIHTSDPESIFQKSFSVIGPAGIEKIEPAGSNILSDAPIILKFAKPMIREEVEKNLQITPLTAIKFNWIDDQNLTLVSEKPLLFGTEYAVSVAAGTKASDGSFLPDAIIHSFGTIGAVTVSSVFPENESRGISVNSDINVKFNQMVDKASAKERIRIYPAVPFGIEWKNDSEMIINPSSELGFDASYTVRMEAGVKSGIGAPESSDFSFYFQTEQEIFKLNIPIDYQDKKLSCEAAALKMALYGKGVKVSENDIMKIVGYDPTKRSNGVWGNPDSAFTGDINGKQNTTGYGVHWEPIARAAKIWRPDSQSFTNWSLKQVIAEVAAGNPVEFWGTMGPAKEDFWKTSSGKIINAWKGEHTRTVIGFTGSRTNPRTIIINDPLGGVLYWPKETFLANWARFNNSGVVVR